jgi:hypothetical protein
MDERPYDLNRTSDRPVQRPCTKLSFREAHSSIHISCAVFLLRLILHRIVLPHLADNYSLKRAASFILDMHCPLRRDRNCLGKKQKQTKY